MSITNKAALARIIAFVLAWLNQLLASNGFQPLPLLGEEEVAAVITFVVSVWTLVMDNKVKDKSEKPAAEE